MSHNTPLTVLGGISAEQFLAEYWQKKPLLVRQAMPQIADLLVPDDVQSLALEENVSARLIKQKDKDPSQWSVKSSPLVKGDFQKLPKHWTLLVQAVEQYSLEINALWQELPFIPQWRRDDIMVSYAPAGGSVGQHFDFYDVFLVQGYGHRRWQLGQMCDEDTAFIEDQPLKLLAEMQVHFDEVLAPGDLLYVPPGLSHYGVAQDDCLTYSFGCRMPNIATMLDRISDYCADTTAFKNPLLDLERQRSTAVGEITQQELAYLKTNIIEQLQSSSALDGIIAALMSEPKYPENLPEPDELEADDLLEIISTGYELMLEPASRLLYAETKCQSAELDNAEQHVHFWGNGEPLSICPALTPLLIRLANAESIVFDDAFQADDVLHDLAHLLNESILMLLPPADQR